MIYFYKVNDEYGCFSNFAHYGFELEGKYWLTSEHFFQAKKFEGTIYEEEIRLMESPMDVANRGRSRKLPLRKDWEDVKDEIMYKAVLNKFIQNKDIQEILLETKDEILIEKTSNNYYWGCGDKGNGKNMLGLILMEVREYIRNQVNIQKL